tara:strand:+ start:2304 stop:3530 length:1227 start_codon:yes stop_codon:yes gene_type:complete
MSTPEAFYRRPIDLNRFNNSVSKKIIASYNEIILDVTTQLATLDEISSPYTAARLRLLLAELQDSLGTWSINSATVTAQELQGLAQLQTEFVQDQLRRSLPTGFSNTVRNVSVSSDFAQSVVTTDPTKINIFALPGEIEAAVRKGAVQPVFSLTAADGAVITLPNGETVQKAFRGLATKQADLFTKTVRNGLLTGESTQKIAKRLSGRLHFGNALKGSVQQIADRGGISTKMADKQIMTILRTSINQVANAASQRVYEANRDVTKKYEYVATLDSRTSLVCARLDGQTFEYGQGPTPPQHFNCRSTTVPVIDYEKLNITPPPKTKTTTRPSESGRVPQKVSYADWLAKQPRSVQEEVFGKWKSQYFVKLSKKEGPQSALRKIVRKDGSELTLDQLAKRYPSLSPSKDA